MFGFLYRHFFKPIAFLLDPEFVHDQILNFGIFLGKYEFTKKIVRSFFYYESPILEQTINGIHFPNPIGLAAGFDKNAQLTQILPEVGFGFAELGSITGEPCQGNPKKRLWRLPKSKSLVVYYGLKNDGAEKIFNRLKCKKFKIPIGISAAKTNNKNTVNLESAIKDYLKVINIFKETANYLTINISCPNAFGGQPFTDKSRLEKLLIEINNLKIQKPIYIKLSPDLSKQNIDEILQLIEKYKIQGIICSNLTKNRKNNYIYERNLPNVGGFSGKVCEQLSNDLISYVYKKTFGKYTIIGCGGIFSAEDAYKKIRLGASLVQLITGMIYEGPQIVGQINYELSKLIVKDGFSNISEVVGIENRLSNKTKAVSED